MTERDSKPSGWIVKSMSELERESKTWPAWKQQDLRERLERDELRCSALDRDQGKEK